MPFRTAELRIATQGFGDIRDLTGEATRLVADAHLQDGLLLLFVPGSTAGLTTIEYESGAIADLKAAIERLAPQTLDYAHDARWGDGNGFAHVRAALLGPSLAVPVADGALALGTWQQIILCDFDNRPRERRLVAHLQGDFASA